MLTDEDISFVQTAIDSVDLQKVYTEGTQDLLHELGVSETCKNETLSLIEDTQMDSYLMNLETRNMSSPNMSSQEFLIKSTYHQLNQSNAPLGWCLTAADKDIDQQLLIQECIQYDDIQNNLQLWTQGPHGEIKLAGPSEDYCIKSRHEQLLLGACTGDDSEKNFEFGSNFISQSKHGKTWRFGYDAYNRFGQVRLYRDIVLRGWTVSQVHENQNLEFLHLFPSDTCQQSSSVVDCDMEDFMDDLMYRCLDEEGTYFTMTILISGKVDLMLRNVGNCAGASCNFDQLSINHIENQVLTSKMASGSILTKEKFALLVIQFFLSASFLVA